MKTAEASRAKVKGVWWLGLVRDELDEVEYTLALTEAIRTYQKRGDTP